MSIDPDLRKQLDSLTPDQIQEVLALLSNRAEQQNLSARRQRGLGSLAGQIRMAPDFDDPVPGMEPYT